MLVTYPRHNTCPTCITLGLPTISIASLTRIRCTASQAGEATTAHLTTMICQLAANQYLLAMAHHHPRLTATTPHTCLQHRQSAVLTLAALVPHQLTTTAATANTVRAACPLAPAAQMAGDHSPTATHRKATEALCSTRSAATVLLPRARAQLRPRGRQKRRLASAIESATETASKLSGEGGTSLRPAIGGKAVAAVAIRDRDHGNHTRAVERNDCYDY